MPIYEYKCEKCGEKFELRRGIADSDDNIKCPRCEAKHPKRVFSTFMTGGPSGGGCSPTAPT